MYVLEYSFKKMVKLISHWNVFLFFKNREGFFQCFMDWNREYYLSLTAVLCQDNIVGHRIWLTIEYQSNQRNPDVWGGAICKRKSKHNRETWMLFRWYVQKPTKISISPWTSITHFAIAILCQRDLWTKPSCKVHGWKSTTCNHDCHKWPERH